MRLGSTLKIGVENELGLQMGQGWEDENGMTWHGAI